MGDTGPQGAQGNQGDYGIPGTQGDTGPMGDTGPQGAQGNQGDYGIPGTQGDTGPMGDTGPQGAQGNQGDYGIPGTQGDTGPMGDTGPQGAQGNQGDYGIPGTQGAQGEPGPVAGNDKNVIYNNSGNAAGSDTFSFDSNSNRLQITDISCATINVYGTDSNVVRRAFGLVASDTKINLGTLSAEVTSSTNQLKITTSESWQACGWSETIQNGGNPAFTDWHNVFISGSGYNMSGAMPAQGNSCRLTIANQTPSAEMYVITVIRAGNTGSQWAISIERIV
jgi:hypothetical protein